MDSARKDDAFHLVSSFLREDEFYLRSSAVYGDKGTPALRRALDLFLKHPEIGFVWLAYLDDKPVGVCVICYAISTSVGGIVVKLDDLFVVVDERRQGIATEMVQTLVDLLRPQDVRRIDTSVHMGNRVGQQFWAKLGFKALQEERVSLVL
jgi:GNAT superfamily N-acetyltransferase